MKLTLQEEINNLEKLIFSTNTKEHAHITFNITPFSLKNETL